GNGAGLTAGKKFLGSQQNFQGIDTGATKVMVTVSYENTAKFSFRIGGSQTGQVQTRASDRMNSIWFRSFTYTAPNIIMPVKLENFSATLRDKMVVLYWATTEERNVSHFVIEKSMNGVNFDEAALLFSDGNSEVLKS